MSVPTLDPLAPAKAADDGKYVQVKVVGGIPLYVPRAVAAADVTGLGALATKNTVAVGDLSFDPATQAELDTVAALAEHHHGTLAARPSSLTLFDAGYWYLAEDEDGGTPYLWTGTAWERAGRPVGSDTIRITQDPYNCKPDRVDLTDGAITLAAPTVITSASAAFASSDVGKPIAVESIGVGGSQIAKLTSGSNAITLTWLTVTISGATGGTWAYTHTGLGTVSGNSATITAAALQTALEALYGAGKVTVTLAGTTYTLTLLSGAASQDISQVSTSGASLTGAVNGAVPAATTVNQSWSYGDVGKRVHIPGAGAAGGVLQAYIGSIEPTTSNVAYLTDAAGVAVNASATGTFTYYTRNWLRTTIAGVTDAHTATLTAGLDAGVKADMAGLSVIYGTDNKAGLQAALDASVVASKPLDLGSGNYLVTGGVSNFTPGGRYVIFGRDADIRAIPTDTEADSGGLRIGGASSEASTTVRARRVLLSDFTWGVPTAHYRGLAAKPVPLEAVTKTAAGGIIISSANSVNVTRVKTDTNYSIAYLLRCCRYVLVANCEASNSWADSFHIENANSVWNAPAYGDTTFIGCQAYNGGDDFYAVNHKHALNGGRPTNISYIGCRGAGMRNHGLGRGVNIEGGQNVTIDGCEVYGTNGPGLQLTAGAPTNHSVLATITTPGTGAQVDFAAAPANVTAGLAGAAATTQMQLFNGATGQTWIGDVTAITNGGLTLTLAARSDQAATCPFTGAGQYAQWGATSDGARFGVGGVNRCTISGFTTDTSVLDTAGDAVTQSAVSFRAGPSSTLEIRDVRAHGLVVRNAYQCGIMFRDALVTTSDVPSARSQLVRDIDVEGFYVDGVGLSTLTGARPWAGVYVQVGQNITLRSGVIKDTDDQAVLVANSNVAGRIKVSDIEGRDIGRAYTTGAPLALAFDPGTSVAYTPHFERLFLSNPAGTTGGTKYVSTSVTKRTTQAMTMFGVNSDITGQALIDESASGYSIAVSPILFRGKGSPEGIVPAGVGAQYERSDGAAGTSLYIKESGTGNTGWVAYGAPGAQAAPTLDMIVGFDPIQAGAAAAWPSAFRCIFVRLRGNGTITQIGLIPGTLSGNCLAAVYASTGSGDAAVPTGAALAASSSTAMSGLTTNVRNFLTFSGAASVAVTHLNHWLMLAVDNTTATVYRLALAQAGQSAGLARLQDQGSLAAPTVSGSSNTAYVPMLWAK